MQLGARSWSLQLPYLAYATVFSPIKLFLASFLSTFPHENGSTVLYAYALIVWSLQIEEVNAIETSEILFSGASFRFLMTDL